MAYRQDFPKHGLIGIWKLAINKKHKYHLLGFKKSSSSTFQREFSLFRVDTLKMHSISSFEAR